MILFIVLTTARERVTSDAAQESQKEGFRGCKVYDYPPLQGFTETETTDANWQNSTSTPLIREGL